MSASSQPAWFVTGTDTGIGKTFIACALLHALRAHGWSAIGMKPVAAGIETVAGLETSEDVERLLAASSVMMDRALVNPYLLRPAISPHLAANEDGVGIELPVITTAYARLASAAQAIVVEGCGGFLVPLGDTIDTADLAAMLGLPVILVVGMRLGCLNHALLTQEAIARRGLVLAGWVANRIDPDMLRFDDNLATLKARLKAPLLGVVPHCPDRDASRAAACLELPL